MLAKLAELMFVEAVRRYVDTLPDDSKGWLAGLRDRFVARALALMHARPAHPWTVEDLARQVGMSRSALAQRFTELLACRRCNTSRSGACSSPRSSFALTDRSLASVAEDVGYESEAAFNRAFKREFGVPPATWRRNAGRSASREKVARERRRIGQHCVGLTGPQQLRHGTRRTSRSGFAASACPALRSDSIDCWGSEVASERADGNIATSDGRLPAFLWQGGRRTRHGAGPTGASSRCRAR